MTEHSNELAAWLRGIERRAAGREHAIARGLGRRRPGTAAGAYRAEGRWQCAGQMDVWDCIAAAEHGADETGGDR